MATLEELRAEELRLYYAYVAECRGDHRGHLSPRKMKAARREWLLAIERLDARSPGTRSW